MSFTSPANFIPRQSVVNSEGLWTKMFDPPTDDPPTPERLDLPAIGLDGNPSGGPYAGVRANPVPSVMQAAGYLTPSHPYTVARDLMHGMDINTWDKGLPGQIVDKLKFFLFRDNDLLGIFNNPQFPAPTVRVPRGAIFHGATAAGGPPPHTIHWHGIEPTPMNDGVGHCSMELGSYTYQWQPNFIGTYFYHCHRNTMQHFEFGLYGLMPFHPPDAFFASIASVTDVALGTVTLNAIPIGAGRDGLFRTAANLNYSGLPFFPGFVGGHAIQGVAIDDPWTGAPFYKFKYDPHAFTVPYDVECLWVLDDRDSVWSRMGSDARDTFPQFGTIPGFNDQFARNPGANGFFNFNDFNADYWFITGFPVQAHMGGSYVFPTTGLVVPPELNSGVSGSRVDVQANVNETVFIRCLDAAYNWTRVTFPMDVVIIEWDGRALGVPPLNRYTRPILLKAGTPITHSTARRWGALLRSTTPFNTPSNPGDVNAGNAVKVEFLDQRSNSLSLAGNGSGDLLMTAFIPIHIN
jgi:hypothetical protein